MFMVNPNLLNKFFSYSKQTEYYSNAVHIYIFVYVYLKASKEITKRFAWIPDKQCVCRRESHSHFPFKLRCSFFLLPYENEEKNVNKRVAFTTKKKMKEKNTFFAHPTYIEAFPLTKYTYVILVSLFESKTCQ